MRSCSSSTGDLSCRWWSRPWRSPSSQTRMASHAACAPPACLPPLRASCGSSRRSYFARPTRRASCCSLREWRAARRPRSYREHRATSPSSGSLLSSALGPRPQRSSARRSACRSATRCRRCLSVTTATCCHSSSSKRFYACPGCSRSRSTAPTGRVTCGGCIRRAPRRRRAPTRRGGVSWSTRWQSSCVCCARCCAARRLCSSLAHARSPTGRTRRGWAHCPRFSTRATSAGARSMPSRSGRV
mmetsp:Transcript_6215/g.18600  ORF Transcript_6215/g.18600 Transcript_6215/m.18600 type:complete len:244 (+) Transcript_6215:242-973(+)